MSRSQNYTKEAIYRVVRDDRDNVLVMHNLDKVSELLFDLARSTELMHLAEVFCDKPVVPLHMEYFSKPALHSSPTPPHQDHAFYREHFDDELAVSFWIALDEVGSTRAPLQFVPCKEKSLFPHGKSETKDFEFQLINLPRDNDYVTVPISKGSCIVHHSFTVHRSAPNQSGLSRRALVFNYRGSDFRLSQNACLQQ